MTGAGTTSTRRVSGTLLTLSSAQTISALGTQVTIVALPLSAVLMLDATPAEMGLLAALAVLPYPVLALWVGAWVDRLRRRRILIATDLCRAVLLGSVPVSALMGTLSMTQLYIVSGAAGCASVWSDLAYTSYVPQVIPREQIVGVNSAVTVVRSGAQVAGPGLGGVAVQVFTAPLAVALDAASYLCSAALLSRIKDDPPAEPGPRRRIVADIVEGARYLLRTPVLAMPAFAMSLVNLFSFVMLAVYALYVVSVLHVGAALYGTVLLLGGCGAVVGGMSASTVARRWGTGRAVIAGTALFGVAPVLVALAGGGVLAVVPMLVAAQFLTTLGLSVLEVNLVSLRQTMTPVRIQGRVGATIRMVNWSMKPLGAVLGGVLGEHIGLRATIWVAVAGGAVGAVWMLLSPIRRVRSTTEARPVPVPEVVS
ncbi:MFS transporter [Actinokineospora diospyrosa]|uniref:Arabinose efflux permease, MFS family n=1 Tax=Actinokineospora diospyrosa TaxID=103728 RepID=A0ABT1IEU4_9PSEU|nr:MFS transporter [Actinokineospora diospyrosa]MCP2271157.1 putative arabinose efflux permease, MFS family [Actinokineospora diospyrosa]